MLALYDLVGWRRVDRIFLPHPLDAHRDHWAVAALMPAIREFWRRCNGSQFPVIHYYLVHRPTYPSGYVQAGLLTPPEDLTGHGHHWYTLPVSPARAARKQAALRCHWSQAMELGPDLNQHVALNELFDAPDPDGGIARGDAPATRLLSGPRIDSVTASLSSRGRAVFELHLAGAPSPQLDYRIYVWSFGPVIINHTVDLKEDTTEQARALIRQLVATPGTSITDPVCVASDSGWIAYLPSKWFNNNFMIYFAADVRWKGTLLNHAGVGWVVPSWY